MSSAEFRIVYDGPGLRQNTMDVKDLAPALLAIGEVLELTNAIFNDERSRVAVKVNASFKTGSFGIDFTVAQNLVEQLKDIFTTGHMASAKELLESIGFWVGGTTIGLFKLIKWLRGRQINKVQIHDDGVCEIVVDDESIEVEQAVLDLYQNWRLRKALEEAISKPLRSGEIDSFAVAQPDSDEFVQVTSNEAGYFVAPELEEVPMDEVEYNTSLQLVSVSFQEGNKWRFTDGENTFYADVQDQDFLDQVERNQTAFAKGDVIKARLRVRQSLAGEKMRSEYDLVQVLDHKRAWRQIPLPIERSEPE